MGKNLPNSNDIVESQVFVFIQSSVDNIWKKTKVMIEHGCFNVSLFIHKCHSCNTRSEFSTGLLVLTKSVKHFLFYRYPDEEEQSDDTLEPDRFILNDSLDGEDAVCTCQCTCDNHSDGTAIEASVEDLSHTRDEISLDSVEDNNVVLTNADHESQYHLDLLKLVKMNQTTDWREMWNPRASMSFTSAKGLLNAPGENNCFLNSAVQVGGGGVYVRHG